MDQERTYKWIQDRLRELHSGTLSGRDLARLKDIARTDAFVADALEGFDTHPNGLHAQHLHAIEQKIKQQKRERRRWLMPNLAITAIAASVLVIIATYTVITRIQKENQETVFVLVAPDSLQTSDSIVMDLAMEEESEKLMATESTGSGAEQTPSAKTSRISRDEEAKTQLDIAGDPDDPTSVIAPEPKPSGTTQPIPASATPPADDQIKVLDGVPISSETEMARSKVEMAGSKKDEGYYANQMNPTLMNSRVTGRIVDAQTGEPIAEAKLSVNFTNQLFFSDITGLFELHIPESEAVLQASYSGLMDSVLVISQGDENIIVGLKTGVLIPSANNAVAKNKGPVASPFDPAIAAHLNFSSYLASSSLLKLSTHPSSARRKVVIQFEVSQDGHPMDITVLETSRDKTYDEEAVRLIKDGPEWVCRGGEYPCVRQYTFYFR